MKYVILGSSAAGISAVRELRGLDKEAAITLISKDKEIYSRCILHHYLGNRRTIEQLNFAEADFAEKYRVEWIKGKACTGVESKTQEVVLEDGSKVLYDKLLIATGSSTFYPPIPGLDGAVNKIGFRNLEDIEQIKETVKSCEHVVIMGAGLVGLDAATGLLEIGVKATLTELADRPLVRQLDKKAAAAYVEAFEQAGVTQIYETKVDEVILDENNKITKLKLNDGTEIPCDYLIVTAGVRANVGFLEGSDIETDRFGLLFDAAGKTNILGVFGAGDVSGRSPIWPAAVKEGIIAASNMAGAAKELKDFFDSKSTMNFLKIPTMSLGMVDPDSDDYIIEIEETDTSYKKVVHKDGKITGAILQGDLSYGGILQQLIAHKIDVSKVKKSIFDVDYSDFFNVKQNFEYFYEEDTNE